MTLAGIVLLTLFMLCLHPVKRYFKKLAYQN